MKKILLFLVCILLVGCTNNKEKNEVTTDDFSNTLTNQKFEVKDNIGIYSNVDYVKAAYIATYDNIVIEYITYDTEENAEKILEQHINSFNMRKSTGASETNEIGKNYHKYILISNDYYMTSTRINSTVIFTSTKLKNKDTVENALKDLGI